VVLYLGGSLALLLLGGGRISFDGAIVADLLDESASTADEDQSNSALTPAYVTVRLDGKGFELMP
jgi:putative oxidoreductase